eukprot:CAMPEP_0176266396 /NCGR_PEP_ID=MMETSP0121_2-20121125/42627_1 /TAXON_ID=160619 /ORGANISM="Kryptoperidinium foliaceum, Strain CCMP 1326" /LENGTH=101 /DNA_ID=CAMNT_0017606437 /DNA_START=9 /DNA_END=311 /DNA_ORIENTATION=-
MHRPGFAGAAAAVVAQRLVLWRACAKDRTLPSTPSRARVHVYLTSRLLIVRAPHEPRKHDVQTVARSPADFARLARSAASDMGPFDTAGLSGARKRGCTAR